MANAGNIPDFFEWASQQQQLDPQLVARVLHAESGGNPNALSPKGAGGLMQLMPGTAKDLGVTNVNDPVDNFLGGTRYLSQQKRQFGTDEKALAAYNFGPGHVQRGDPYPKETQDYIQRVMGDQQQGGQQTAPPDFLEWAAQQQTAAPAAPEGKSLAGFGSNLMSSAGEFGSGIMNAIVHPINTATNLGKLGLGAAEKILPDSVKETVGDFTPMADAVGHHFADRYGGVQNIIDTLYKDPVGAAADASMLFGVGGAALPGKVGKLAGLASEVTNPLNAVIKPASMVGKLGAEGMMARALNLPLKLREEFGVGKLARTALDEGINVSDKGLQKVKGIRSGIAADKAGIESEAMAAGRTVDPEAIYNRVQELTGKKGVGVQMFPENDLKALQDVAETWKTENTSPIMGKRVTRGEPMTEAHTTAGFEDIPKGEAVTPSMLKDWIQQQDGYFEYPGVRGPVKPMQRAVPKTEDVVTGHKINFEDVAVGEQWNAIKDLLGLEADKQGTYMSLKDAFRKLSDRPGRTQAEATAALGAKDELERATAGFTNAKGQDLHALNQHDAQLNAIGQATKKALTQDGPNLGLDALMALLGGHAGILGVVGHQILSRPQWASVTAHGLDWLRKTDNPILRKAGVIQPYRALTAKTALLRALQGQD